MSDMRVGSYSGELRGFTLIETLVYLALFSIVMGGLMSAAYGFFESLDTNKTRAMLQMEGDFLISRIDRSLEAAQAVTVISPSEISTIPWSPAAEAVKICGVAGDMRFLRGSGACALHGEVLNGEHTMVTSLTFVHHPRDGAYERIEAGIVLVASTSAGRNISITSSTTVYLPD